MAFAPISGGGTYKWFQAAVEGNLKEAYANELAILEKATTGAIRTAVSYTVNNFRRQTDRAGLGRGLSKAWQNKMYPKSGNSLNAAGMVFSKAKRIHSAFGTGGIVKGKAGPLLIPTKFAEDEGLATDASKGKGGAIDRKWFNVPAAEARFGPLFSHRSAFGAVWLMGHTHALSSRRGDAVALARIIPQVRLKRLLDLEGPPKQFKDKIPQYIVNQVARAERPRPTGTRVTVG